MRRSIVALLSLFAASQAQAADDMAGMSMPGMDMGKAEEEDAPLGAGPNMQSGMAGALGSYSMMRDASGTAWQPDSSPMEGLHGTLGDWTTMLHGEAFAIYDSQGGKRGGDNSFSASMLMGMAQRSLDTGTLTLRTMLSLDPAMGKSGYPLLLQTGETADGKTPLVDRQHPHDLFMELAGIYSLPVTDNSSAFVYLGYPGEPALGPATFMHRFSGMSDPEAPISHHWLDSTHITFGVATLGYTYNNWKIEGSVFNGREPDQHRWNFDDLKMNSASARLSWNPDADWSLQVSYGFIQSPEQLEPNTNQHRLTASASYNRKFDNGNWQTTLAFGQNRMQPGDALNAALLESTVTWQQHTVFARAENADKDELFLAPNPLAGQSLNVAKLSVGYIYDIPVAEHLSLGLGGLGSVYSLPDRIKPSYGSSPTSVMLFARLRVL